MDAGGAGEEDDVDCGGAGGVIATGEPDEGHSTGAILKLDVLCCLVRKWAKRRWKLLGMEDEGCGEVDGGLEYCMEGEDSVGLKK